MNYNKKYVPDVLSEKDKKKQIQSIRDKTERPKVDYKPRRSKYVVAFEKKYDTKINDMDFINKNIIRKKGIDLILDKGRGAYYTSGSRPNQTAESWALARLASVIMNGAARKIDIKIWNKYKR